MKPAIQIGSLLRAASDSGLVIQTEDLTKTYGGGSRGITELNLEVRDGEVFGFLGPNGAGKTTTIRLLLNLIKPTAGKATVLGLDSQHDSIEIHRHIGYLPGEYAFYSNLTGAKTLEYFAHLRGVAGAENWQYVKELAGRLELDMTKKFRQYSRGNKQKVGIIQALMHRPKLLILDEPTSGLDPLNQQEFYKLINEIRDTGSTIFFSSHIMSEVEKICDRVGIIREGRLVKVGNIGELTDLKSHQLELTFAEAVPLAEFEKLPGFDHLKIISTNSHETLHCTVRTELLDLVVKTAAKYQLVNFVSREPSLEETFLDYYRAGNPTTTGQEAN